MSKVPSSVVSRQFIADALQARKELNYSQRDLARDLGVTPTTICCWESGRRPNLSFESAVRLACALGLDLNQYKECLQ